MRFVAEQEKKAQNDLPAVSIMNAKFPLSLFLSVCLSCRFFPSQSYPPPLLLSYLRTQLFLLNDPLAAAKALCRDHQRRSLQEAEEATAKEGGGPEREARCREPEEGPDSRHQVSFCFLPLWSFYILRHYC